MSDDKDLPPSEKKLEKALEENQDQQSDEINHLATLVVLGGLFYTTVPATFSHLIPLLSLEQVDWRRLDNVHALLVENLQPVGLWAEQGALVLLGASLMSGLIGNLINRRRPPSAKMPSISYNPLSKITGLFQPSALLSTAKLWVFALIMMGLTCLKARQNLPVTLFAIYTTPSSSIALAMAMVTSVLPIVLGLSVFSALIDAYQKHASFIKQNKMDQEEVKQENKEDNGDPLIKSKRMELMRG